MAIILDYFTISGNHIKRVRYSTKEAGQEKIIAELRKLKETNSLPCMERGSMIPIVHVSFFSDQDRIPTKTIILL